MVNAFILGALGQRLSEPGRARICSRRAKTVRISVMDKETVVEALEEIAVLLELNG